MTIRVGHTKQGKRNRDQRRGPMTPIFPAKTIKRQGITPRSYQGRTAQDLPLTERHERVLRMVDIEDPIRPGEIAEVLELPRGGVVSTLYALQDRGLVERIPFKGWVKK